MNKTLYPFHKVVFIARGEPAFSDVPDAIADHDTYEAAEATGLRMLSVGNWLSFTIEKRYVRSGGDAK